MLDTNICIDLLRGRNPALVRKVSHASSKPILISAISVAELWHGAAKSSRPSFNEARLRSFLVPFHIESFDDDSAHEYGMLHAELSAQGHLIGPLDLLIAAHALATGSILITDNLREFKRVPGLQVQNWRR